MLELQAIAYNMQSTAPEAIDVDSEPQHVKDLYGLDGSQTDDFARKCILSRRLVERGTRFIQIYSGGAHNDSNWDAHGDLKKIMTIMQVEPISQSQVC